jgi:hypothetical protein
MKNKERQEIRTAGLQKRVWFQCDLPPHLTLFDYRRAGRRTQTRDTLASPRAFGDSILHELDILEGPSQGHRRGAALHTSLRVSLHLPRFTAVVHMPERYLFPPCQKSKGVILASLQWSRILSGGMPWLTTRFNGIGLRVYNRPSPGNKEWQRATFITSKPFHALCLAIQPSPLCWEGIPLICTCG